MFKRLLKYLGLLLHNLIFTLGIIWGINQIQAKPSPKYLTVTVTAYQPHRAQTDASPFVTSIGSTSIMGIVACSQDLLKDGRLHYGDVVRVPGLGVFMVQDTMNVRYTNAIDILVRDRIQVKLVGKRHNIRIEVIKRET